MRQRSDGYQRAGFGTTPVVALWARGDRARIASTSYGEEGSKLGVINRIEVSILHGSPARHGA